MSEPGKSLILYVEDNPENRMLVRRVLLAEKYSLSAQETFEILKSRRPDLILMDINMPDMDGYTLTAQIKAMQGFEKVPILAITANVMRGDREKTIEAGCDGYIQKPIDIDQLVREIEKFLARRAHA